MLEKNIDDLYALVGKCVEYARKTGMLQKDAALEETFLQNIEKRKMVNPFLAEKLKSGLIALENYGWENAILYFDAALDIDPECSEAHIGKLLAGKKMRYLSELRYNPIGLSENTDYQRAVRYAGENKAYYEGLADDMVCITLLETVLGKMDCDARTLNGCFNLLPEEWYEKSAKLKAAKEQNEQEIKKHEKETAMAKEKIVICRNCGTFNSGMDNFCKECGTRLKDGENAGNYPEHGSGDIISNQIMPAANILNEKDASSNGIAFLYAAITLLITFTALYIQKINDFEYNVFFAAFLYLLPMIVALLFAVYEKQNSIFTDMFFQQESVLPYFLAIFGICVWYGISAILDNVYIFDEGEIPLEYIVTGIILAALGEEIGWRWYLQKKLKIENFTGKMLVISVICFLWYFSWDLSWFIVDDMWITAEASDYVIFYLVILGQTFMYGAVREYSKGAVPCTIAHIAMNALSAAAIYVQQDEIAPISILALTECFLSIIIVSYRKKRMV